MAKVKDILAFMEAWAPSETRMSYDNTGLLVGNAESEVTKVLITLDITPDAADEAIEQGAELIISHHPLIFHPFYNLTGATHESATAAKLIKHDISAICMHTNLDIAGGGVGDALAEALGLEDVCAVEAEPVLRVGKLPREMSAEEFAAHVSECLDTAVKFVGGQGTIRRVSVCGGSGGSDDEYFLAKNCGCDAYVSGEFKHHILLDAANSGFTVVDAGHYATERPICGTILKKLKENFPTLDAFIGRQGNPEKYCIYK